MHAGLAQLAALAAHAKAASVDARAGGDDHYWRHHSTFAYVASVHFVVRRRAFLRARLEPQTLGVAEWVAAVGVEADGLAPVPIRWGLPTHVAAAFAGSLDHGLATGSRHFWFANWSLSKERDPEHRIWSVTYTKARAGTSVRSDIDIDAAAERLSASLHAITAFAGRDQHLSAWAATFDEALLELERPEPRPPYHPDILPQRGYSLRARQLLAAAVRAWVFGGMGSWNDCGPADPQQQPRHDLLTRELYAAVTGAIASAVNRGLS